MISRHRVPRRAEIIGRERWLVSYTDVITILLILFVAIAAKGVQQRLPVQRPKPLPPPAVTPLPSHTPLEAAKGTLERGGFEPKLEARGLVISLPQAILFPSGEDRISPAALPAISQIADVLARLPNRVILTGYADGIPIHNQRFRSNWELSSARALALLQLLSDRYGIPESRLSMASYGSYRPKNTNDTEAGRAENRRVEIVIQGS